MFDVYLINSYVECVKIQQTYIILSFLFLNSLIYMRIVYMEWSK